MDFQENLFLGHTDVNLVKVTPSVFCHVATTLSFWEGGVWAQDHE